MLDNTGQGLLTFGENLMIDEEYSAECIDIFGCDIGGMCFIDLVRDYIPD